jgi:hypothetical protein
LANRASEEYAAGLPATEAYPSYLLNDAGEMEGDPNVAEYRATKLMELFGDGYPQPSRQQLAPRTIRTVRVAESVDDAAYDELDLLDLANVYEYGELDESEGWSEADE